MSKHSADMLAYLGSRIVSPAGIPGNLTQEKGWQTP